MTYHWMYSKRHTTGATSGAESYPSGLQCDSCCLLDVLFSVQCFVDHCLSFFVFQPLYCLSVDLQRLFTPLVSSSFQAIILSVRRFTSSVYSFSIFKLQAIILSVRRCLSTPLVSSSFRPLYCLSVDVCLLLQYLQAFRPLYCLSVDVCLLLQYLQAFRPLYCLSVDLHLLFTSLVSSSFRPLYCLSVDVCLLLQYLQALLIQQQL